MESTSAPRYHTRSSRSPTIAIKTKTVAAKRTYSPDKRASKRNVTPKTAGAITKTKKKRRSSIRRRSLVATLECIQSNEVSSHAAIEDTVKTSDSNLTAVKVNGKEPIPESQVNQDADIDSQSLKTKREDTTPEDVHAVITSESRESSAVKMDVISEENLLDCSLSPSKVTFNEKDATYISLLKKEIAGWKAVKKKYKKIESDAGNELRSNAQIETRLEGPSASFLTHSEQIDDLEDRLANAISIVSNTMANVQKITELHALKQRKVQQAEISRVCNARGGQDPKWLIENIFRLDNMKVDS